MNAPNVTKLFLLTASVIAAGLFLVRCELGQPPPQEMTKAAICDGQPDWCLLATSGMDGGRAAYIYIDGKLKGHVLPGKTARIPVGSGGTHLVQYCAVFDTAKGKEWQCTPATGVVFDKDNSTLAVSPTNQTLIACDPNRPC